MPGRASSLPLMRKRRLGGWSPRTLFAGGENGFWFDQTDFSTMFQDNSGNTPVTAVEQPVGLLLDKRGSYQNFPVPTFVLSGSVTQVGNTLTFSAPASGASADGSGLTLNAHAVSVLTITVTSGTVNIYHGGTTTSYTTSGQKIFRALVASNGNYIIKTFTGFVGTVVIDSITQWVGNNALQATSASRPTLSARVNLLTYTEDFSNAAWAKTNVTQSGSVSDPLGGTKAFTVTATLNGGYISQTFTVTSGHAYTNSVWLRRRTGTGEVRIGAINGQGGPNQAVAVTSTWTRFTAPNAFYTNVASSGTGYFFIELQTSGDAVDVAFPDSRAATESSSLPAYQRVTTTTNYDTIGFPYYLSFDGTDDSLATGTINPGAVDKAQIFVGVRKLTDTPDGIVCELSANVAGNSGSFYVAAPEPSSGKYTMLSHGTTAINANQLSAFTAAGAAPDTAVITGLGDISGDRTTVRRNGVPATSATGDQGTGNYGSYPLYIGRRNGSTIPFNGRIYGLIGRFSSSNLDAETIAKVERWMNNKTKAY